MLLSKKNEKFVFILLLILPFPATSNNDWGMSFPGSAVMSFNFPGSEHKADIENSVLQINLMQSINVFKITPTTYFNVFTALEFSKDDNDITWRNKVATDIGFRIRQYFFDAFVVDLGAKYEYEYQYHTNQGFDGFTGFLDWNGSWDFKCYECPGSGGWVDNLNYPGWTWGQLRYPSSHNPVEQNDWIVEGSAQQGIDWISFGKYGTFNTFVELGYVADSNKLDWNNSVELSVGAQHKIPVSNGLGVLVFDVRYKYDYAWLTDIKESDFLFSITWAVFWDPNLIRYFIPE